MDEYKFYSYVDNKSILVITPKNALIRIKCPFAVMDASKKIFQVDAVSSTRNKIYYQINGKDFLYHNYNINIESDN